jgi:hypothetical protein
MHIYEVERINMLTHAHKRTQALQCVQTHLYVKIEIKILINKKTKKRPSTWLGLHYFYIYFRFKAKILYNPCIYGSQ